jgi:hypothetical protein
MAAAEGDVRLLVLGLLAVLAAGLLTVAAVHGYRDDQRRIHFFAGTGVAGKIDVIGNPPSYLLIASEKSSTPSRIAVAADGTFAARLDREPIASRFPETRDRHPWSFPAASAWTWCWTSGYPLSCWRSPGKAGRCQKQPEQR